MISPAASNEDASLLLNFGKNVCFNTVSTELIMIKHYPSTSHVSQVNTSYVNKVEPAHNHSHNDVVDLSSDDEETAPTNTSITPRFRPPMVTLRYSDDITVKREATLLTDLLQKRYMDSFIIDPLMRHRFIHGSKHHLGYVDSQKFDRWGTTAQKYRLKNITDRREALDFLNENPKLYDDLYNDPELRDIICDSSKEYTAIVVFLEKGKHWFLIIVARLAQWLQSRGLDRLRLCPPIVHIFDSLLQDIEKKDGHNYRILPNLHRTLLEERLFPILRLGALIHSNDPSLFKTQICHHEVREVFGQSNTYDCGAFVMLFTEKIANGELVECKELGKNFAYWFWEQEDWIPYDKARMEIGSMIFFRARCYEFLKAMVINGQAELDQAELRLVHGESAFEREDPWDPLDGPDNQVILTTLGFPLDTPIQNDNLDENKMSSL